MLSNSSSWKYPRYAPRLAIKNSHAMKRKTAAPARLLISVHCSGVGQHFGAAAALLGGVPHRKTTRRPRLVFAVFVRSHLRFFRTVLISHHIGPLTRLLGRCYEV